MGIPNSPIRTSDFMREGKYGDEFDHVAGWQAIRPRWDTLPANVRALFVYTRLVAAHIGQARDLSLPWPDPEQEALHPDFDALQGTLRTRFSKVPGEFLEPAMELVWALGHWLPFIPDHEGKFTASHEDILLFRGSPPDGCYWKFAEYAMKSLIERKHELRAPFAEESSGDRVRRKLREKYGQSEGGHFRIVDSVAVPHPYVIGPSHIAAAENGILDKYSIERAEREGRAHCLHPRCQLKLHEHEKALLVECERELKNDKGEVDPELQAYIVAKKEQAEKDGYAGFSFIKARD
jgi:hypothetical protein